MKEDEHNDEIDLRELFSIAWSAKKLILSSRSCSFLIQESRPEGRRPRGASSQGMLKCGSGIRKEGL